jgi:hypothetical protein
MTGGARPHRANRGAMPRNRALAHAASRLSDGTTVASSVQHHARMVAKKRFSAAC